MGGNRMSNGRMRAQKLLTAKVVVKATSQPLLRDLGENSPFFVFAVKVFGCPSLNYYLGDYLLVRRGRGL
jgi:hypothetical protein